MHKNLLAVGITILFLGLAIQPSVAIVQPEKINKEYVEITIEICGLPRVKHNTIQLPKEQAEAFRRD